MRMRPTAARSSETPWRTKGADPARRPFGVLLRRYRLAAGLSQEALAERARMSTNGISALERGYRRTPQRETLTLLAVRWRWTTSNARELRGERCAFRLRAPRGPSVRSGLGPMPAMANLPLALTSFVGRERGTRRDRDARARTSDGHTDGRRRHWQDSDGVAGCNALSDAADGDVCFIGLAPIGDSALVAAAIASALGVQEVPNRPLLETLLAYLKNKTLLLILDNCEHVITQAAIVAEALLSCCLRVRILATSREPLKAAGEYTYRLPSLSIPSPDATRGIRVTDALAYGAIALFADRAQAAEDRFMLTDENAPIVANVCRRLDGIPLAIELAAARVNVLSLKMLTEKLDDRFRDSHRRYANCPAAAADAACDDRLELRLTLGTGATRFRAPLGLRRRVHAGDGSNGLLG